MESWRTITSPSRSESYATLFARKGRRLGEVLVELNIIQSEEVEDFVRMQILEVSSNVSTSRPGIRIDVAYALDPIDGRSRWLLSAGSRIGF